MPSVPIITPEIELLHEKRLAYIHHETLLYILLILVGSLI